LAALNVLDGTIIGRNMARHRHQEFMRFFNAINADVPADKAVHGVLDNYAAHKHPEGPRLARPPPALHLPFHPHLRLLAERGRGLLRQALQAAPQARRVLLARRAAISRFVAKHNQSPSPLSGAPTRTHRRRPRTRVPSVGVGH
jgi:hypothetical protein